MTNPLRSPTGRPVTMACQIFPELTLPNGFLRPELACQALWFYYALTTKQNADIADDIQYEGDIFAKELLHRRQIFTSIALRYGVTPEEMIRFWPNIDAQCAKMGGKKLYGPDRFDTVPELKTQ